MSNLSVKLTQISDTTFRVLFSIAGIVLFIFACYVFTHHDKPGAAFFMAMAAWFKATSTEISLARGERIHAANQPESKSR